MYSRLSEIFISTLCAFALSTKAVALTPLARAAGKTLSVPIYQDANRLGYYANISVGTPPQEAVVVIDTGSSDLWIFSDSVTCRPANACQGSAFDPSKSSTFKSVAPGDFLVEYAGGNGARGDYISETVQLGGVTIDNVIMGLASLAVSPNGLAVQGIMGIGMLLEEAVRSQNRTGYFNLPYRLTAEGLVDDTAYSIYLNDIRSQTGSVLFGGIDTDKYSGELAVFPITPTSLGLVDFLLPVTSMSLVDSSGTTSLTIPSQYQAAGIPALLDTGSTAMSLPESIVDVIYQRLSVMESNVGPVVPCSLANSGTKLLFGLGGSSGPTITVDLAEVIRRTSLIQSNTYCSFDIFPQDSGSNAVSVLGDSFLRSTYVVFDPGNGQIGIAQAKLNSTSSNIQALSEAVPVPTGEAFLPTSALGNGASFGGVIPGSTVGAGAQPTSMLGLTAVRTSAVLPSSALLGSTVSVAMAAAPTQATSSAPASSPSVPTFKDAAASMSPPSLSSLLAAVFGAFIFA